MSSTVTAIYHVGKKHGEITPTVTSPTLEFFLFVWGYEHDMHSDSFCSVIPILAIYIKKNIWRQKKGRNV